MKPSEIKENWDYCDGSRIYRVRHFEIDRYDRKTMYVCYDVLSEKLVGYRKERLHSFAGRMTSGSPAIIE